MNPVKPSEAGVEERVPELAQIEAARVLADEARDRLHHLRFTDDEIDKWAETYVAEQGSGDVDSFLDWIRQREAGQGPSPSA